MGLTEELRTCLENEEAQTVGTAFGGTGESERDSYSVSSVREVVTQYAPFNGRSTVEKQLADARRLLPDRLLSIVITNLVRYSFLIELTNLSVGSTKMKTRWLPGKILMPQANSFEPIKGTFQPGEDPRAATFDECLKIFGLTLSIVCEKFRLRKEVGDVLLCLNSLRRIPYEFPFSYADPSANPVHTATNVAWAMNKDILWLLQARALLHNAKGPDAEAIHRIEDTKLEVKVFKTDRSLTGKDKTNRAKRWEVLAGDFQHATLEQCWSAERKLTHDLACFDEFPSDLGAAFTEAGLVEANPPPTRCPVTLEILSFKHLSKSVLDPKHGVSQYQIGHSLPLKRGGKHDGTNVCWQSANGNRIQGDLSVKETWALLDVIAARKAALKS